MPMVKGRHVRQKPHELKGSTVATSAKSHTRLKGKRELCPPEAIGAQSPNKCNYVRQRPFGLKSRR